jgi:hypothetical protein
MLIYANATMSSTKENPSIGLRAYDAFSVSLANTAARVRVSRTVELDCGIPEFF